MNDDILTRKFTLKLEEALAFERVVLRLYEAIIEKCGHARELMLVQDELMHFLDEEREHAAYLETLLDEADGDKGAAMPGNTVAEAVSQTLQNLMNETLVPVIRNLEVVLTAELVNHFQWRLLADLAEKLERKQAAVHLMNKHLQKQDHVDGLQLILHEQYGREN